MILIKFLLVALVLAGCIDEEQKEPWEEIKEAISEQQGYEFDERHLIKRVEDEQWTAAFYKIGRHVHLFYYLNGKVHTDRHDIDIVESNDLTWAMLVKKDEYSILWGIELQQREKRETWQPGNRDFDFDYVEFDHYKLFYLFSEEEIRTPIIIE